MTTSVLPPGAAEIRTAITTLEWLRDGGNDPAACDQVLARLRDKLTEEIVRYPRAHAEAPGDKSEMPPGDKRGPKPVQR